MLPKKRVDVLVVDDNVDDVLLFEEALYDAEALNLLGAVYNGVDALAYLRREGAYTTAGRPDLIILDINMPKKNGFETLEELKADPVLCEIPVIMMTTSQREEDIAKSYRKGASSYISKPVEFEHLMVVVKQVEEYWSRVVETPGIESFP